MADRPILFSAPMVRALLDGTKTQTRRIVAEKWSRHLGYLGAGAATSDPADWGFWSEDEYGRWAVLGRGLDERHQHGKVSLPCRHGEPGSTLWVRETWGLHKPFDLTDWHAGSLKGATALPEDWELDYRADWGRPDGEQHWRPSILMPRWASRLTLEVEGVRVQRLQEISEEDAGAEGVEPIVTGIGDYAGGIGVPVRSTLREAFSVLWDRINGERASWASNPWCWVLAFKRVEVNHG